MCYCFYSYPMILELLVQMKYKNDQGKRNTALSFSLSLYLHKYISFLQDLWCFKPCTKFLLHPSFTNVKSLKLLKCQSLGKNSKT